ncbi:MAG: DUF167 domain-containing protein [Candidatus Pacearchaeota archaeon]
MIIKIKVKPNSSENKIDNEKVEGMLVVSVKEPPQDNKANLAVIKALSKYYNAKVKIISGKTSKIKLVSVE